MVAKATAMVEVRLRHSDTPPNSEGLADDCGFVYPLLVYWNRSLSVPLFFSLSLSLYSKSYHAFPISPIPVVVLSFLHPSSSLVHLSSFFLRLNPLDQANPLHRPPRLHLPSLSYASFSSLAFHLPISISSFLFYCAIRRRPSATYTKSTDPRLLLRDTR